MTHCRLIPKPAGNHMKDQIEILVSLQKIEVESVNIKAHLSAVSKHLELLIINRTELELRISDVSAKIEELNKTYRSHESEVKQNQGMIKRSQERLNSIKNNREYQALLKEIEELKRTNSKIEDMMIDCLNETDAAEKNIASLKEDLDLLNTNIQQEQNAVDIETKAADSQMEDLNAERLQLSGKIEPNILQLFQKIQAQQTKGIAVVPVQDFVCHGCYVNIPPQMYNELQRCDTLRMCPNCQRIIYWKQD